MEVSGADTEAQQAADRLAIALEEAGFDVGREFPALQGMLNGEGAPVVNVGRVPATIARRLAAILSEAALR